MFKKIRIVSYDRIVVLVGNDPSQPTPLKIKTRTDFVQRPAAVKFENVFRISEVRVKGVKIAIKPWIPP